MTARRFSQALLVVLLAFVRLSHAEEAAPSLEGVWGGTRHFGPAVRGTLEVTRSPSGWRAEIGPYDVQPVVKGRNVSFELPHEQGRFAGRLEKDETAMRGWWIQPPVSPIFLRARGKNQWVGEVVPLEQEWTVYLVFSRKPDGELGAFIRNPDRNQGVFWQIERVEQDGDRLRLFCKAPCQGNKEFDGRYDAERKRLTVYFPDRGGSYDLTPIGDDAAPGFYARGKNPPPYKYLPPTAANDGWTVGTLDEVGMAREPLAEMVRTISTPPASLDDPDIHALLIARHGKLVMEEYFHGYHRHKMHDTRSATKAIAATLVGATMQSGAKLSLTDRVYDVVYKGKPPAGLETWKREMTVEHLLTMSSGYDCNDWADSPRPGSEDTLTDEQPDRDYYRYTLQLPMEYKPGTQAAYCSVNANLLGAVLTAATGEPVSDLFERLIAEPLHITRYSLGPQPTGEIYLAGGMFLLPRDFMKFGQLMLSGGVWNGKRIVSEDYARRAGTPHVTLRDQLWGMRFGYLWWTTDYEYKGKKVQAYFASGNGGQEVVVIPELDLVIGSYGGSYNAHGGWALIRDYIPKYILPALD